MPGPVHGVAVVRQFHSVLIARTDFPVPDGSNIHSVSKNAPTLASCSFDKHGLILIIFGKRHQHTFKSDAPVRLSLSVHVYLVYLLLNSSR